MGIKNFRNFLLSKIEEPFEKIKFENMNIKSLCVDINIFIYKYITAIRKTGNDIEHNGTITSHIIGLRNQINFFKKLKIDIIYVFDGTPPIEKNKILQERKNKKEYAEKKYTESNDIKYYQQSFFITSDIIKSAKKYLKYRGIKYIDLDLEADIICASLVKNKIVDYVYSTDYDIIVYGAKTMITSINYKKRFVEILNLKNILKNLNITYEQFVDMIVLSGCDYCDKTENMTLNKAYDVVNSNKNIKLNICAMKAKKIFTAKYKIKKSDIKVNKYNSEKLKKFLNSVNLKS